MSLTIRAATPDDDRLLARLNGCVHDLHRAARPEVFKAPREADLAAWYRRRLGRNEARIFVAEFAGDAVGYVLAVRHERAENPFCVARTWWEVDQIAVAPEHRRRGIGRALVERVRRDAAGDGAGVLELTAWTFNEPARRAFERLGFVPVMTRFELREPEER